MRHQNRRVKRVPPIQSSNKLIVLRNASFWINDLSHVMTKEEDFILDGIEQYFTTTNIILKDGTILKEYFPKNLIDKEINRQMKLRSV